MISTLRRASYRWPERSKCVKSSRVSRGLYKCNKCQKLVKNKEYIIDHVKPVISIKDGFVSWDSFINNLFCSVENFQLLCYACADAKTLVEKELRKYYKNVKKNIDKD